MNFDETLLRDSQSVGTVTASAAPAATRRIDAMPETPLLDIHDADDDDAREATMDTPTHVLDPNETTNTTTTNTANNAINNNNQHNHNNNNHLPERRREPQIRQRNNSNNDNDEDNEYRVSRAYGWVSLCAAILAIVTTAQTPEVVTVASSSTTTTPSALSSSLRQAVQPQPSLVVVVSPLPTETKQSSLQTPPPEEEASFLSWWSGSPNVVPSSSSSLTMKDTDESLSSYNHNNHNKKNAGTSLPPWWLRWIHNKLPQRQDSENGGDRYDDNDDSSADSSCAASTSSSSFCAAHSSDETRSWTSSWMAMMKFTDYTTTTAPWSWWWWWWWSHSSTTNSRQQQRDSSFVWSWVDPTIRYPSGHTVPDVIDKVLTSTPRLVAVANFVLSLTYLLHMVVAHWFLQEWGRRRRRPSRQQTLHNNNNNTATTTTSSPPPYRRAAAQHREKLGGFLVFKLLLISAVVTPDTLELLILLTWYTALSFLRSLVHLCGAAIQHGTAAGQVPPPGVLPLLITIWCSNAVAASFCVALFHAAGAGMVCLLTTDCVLLAVDVVTHVVSYLQGWWEVHHAQQLAALEEEEDARLRRQPPPPVVPQDNHDNDGNDDGNDADPVLTPNQLRMQRMEQGHTKRMAILDTLIFGLQFLSHLLTIAHFLHIWSLHGLQLTLIDGVLALHLHSAISSASRQIAQRRNLHRIARHLDQTFADVTEMELRKHTNDVCCVCLCALSSHVKKVACGHMYHVHCLREVVERARSMETAKCPLCRASVLHGRRPGETPAAAATASNNHTTDNNDRTATRQESTAAAANANDWVPIEQTLPQPPAQGQAQEQLQQPQQPQQEALFRFSTDSILPSWVPFPNFSFEIVRRPAALPAEEPEEEEGRNGTSWIRRFLLLAGAVPMTPAEEAAAMEQLVDMFPQYDRADLMRELRQRGSIEGVAEAILTGVFTAGVPR